MNLSLHIHLDEGIALNWGTWAPPGSGQHSLSIKAAEVEYASVSLFLNDETLRALHRALSERVALLPVQPTVAEPASGGGGALAAMSSQEMP